MPTEAGLRHKSRIYIRTHRALHGAGTGSWNRHLAAWGPNLRPLEPTPLPSLDCLHSSIGEQLGFLHFPAYCVYNR